MHPVTNPAVVKQLGDAPWQNDKVVQPAPGPWTKYGQGGNPFDQFDGQGATPGFVQIGPPNPKFPLDVQHMRGENQIQAAEMGRQGALTAQANASATEAAARAQYAAETAKAQRDKAVADAALAQQNAAGATSGGLSPNSNVHGDDYLKSLPSGLAATVKAVATGNVMLPANALRVPYWQQVLQHTLNYDPEFNAADYNTRAHTRQDFANGKMGINITALNTALGHAGEVLNDVSALNNSGGLVGTSIWNPIANAYLKHSGDPRVTNFNNDTMAFGGELGKVFSGSSGGGQGEREEWRTSIPLNGSPDQQVGVLTQDAKLLRSRIEAINEQYKRGMGRTADISDLLDPHARQVYAQLLGTNPGAPMPPGGGAGTGGTDASSPGGGGPSAPGGGIPPGWAGAGAPVADRVSLATGPTHLVNDPKAAALIDTLIRRGAGADEINAAIAPLGFKGVDPAAVAAAQAYLRKNPGYKGSLGGAQRAVPTTAWNRVASSPAGTGLYAGIDAALGGTTDEMSGAINGVLNGTPISQSIADANARKQLAFATNPKAAVTGSLIGGALGYYGGAKLLGGLNLSANLGRATPYLGAAAYGAGTGAGQDNNNRLGGAVLGAGGGAIGQGLGELAAIPIGAGARVLSRSRPVEALRGMFGQTPEIPSPLSPGQRSAIDVVRGAGVDEVRSALSDAHGLGVPMSLADTSPQISSLAAAAVRRSPNAAAYAEGQLIPRSRGQIDRFGNAVTRDLGPVGNIPQTSADLMAQARTAAGPLYDAAYAAPAVGSPELDSLLNTPAGRQAMNRARTIAANERRNPEELGFRLDDQGNVALNPVRGDLYGAQAQARAELQDAQQALKAARAPGVDRDAALARVQRAREGVRATDSALSSAPSSGTAATSNEYSPQTLDYVKRGLDDVIDGLPKGLSGRPIMDENYRAVDGVRRQLLTELDKLNPAYGQARSAYAGPAASREALGRGVDAFTLTPDELGVQVAGQSPEHLSQMQLGYRSELMNRANSVRDTSNPFEATLSSPAARGRIDALYPDNPGNASLFRTRDLEQRLARTTNDVLGNSKTAQRQIADQAFEGSSLPSLAVDAALMAHGGVPVASIARGAARGGIGDWMKLGIGRRSVRKADEIAPILLNTDPQAAQTTLDDLIKRELAYRAYMRSSRPTGPSGMFGASLGATAVSRP